MGTFNVIDHKAGKDEWLTPPAILQSLGEFDLDPCAPINRPWATARQHYTILDNGLLQEWFGRVWMNPPYGKELGAWLNRMALHGDGIAFTFARTGGRSFQNFVFPYADSILFLAGRTTFYNVDGSPAKRNAGAPSLLIAYGDHNSDQLAACGLPGAHVLVNKLSILVLGVDKTWKHVVEIVMVKLNQPAALEKIYDQVERVAGDKVKKNPHYKAKIRQVVQLHFKRIKRGVYAK